MQLRFFKTKKQYWLTLIWGAIFMSILGHSIAYAYPLGREIALDFDGVDDYVTLGSESWGNFGTGAFTIEAWFRIGDPTSGVILSKAGGNNTDISLRVRPDYGVYFHVRGSDQNMGNFAVPSIGTYNDGQWHHIAGVRDASGTAHLYVDGNPEGTPNSNCNGIIDNPYGFYLGTSNPNIWSDYYFNGAIDEARVWNTARSQTEIQANLNRELTGSEANLIGLWHINEGQGLFTADTADGHNGILGAHPHTPTWIEEPIPEPTTICLVGLGLLGILGVILKQRRKLK